MELFGFAPFLCKLVATFIHSQRENGGMNLNQSTRNALAFSLHLTNVLSLSPLQVLSK